ncbi:alpha/beta hydrolase [Eubacterium sp. 1001713B170207_170306_E7]|uniref:alpha/beta hydrolase n=1 Tax=Eubacterium sp. 1001713B170207_170306_E7 TaxID=2787097 RepID=UPI001897CE28|nr:alpha/beta hydrolase [Eubacterium sp. 1001713B170207_170306_E7]
MKHKRLKQTLAGVAAALLFLLPAGGIAVNRMTYQPEAEAREALKGNSRVTVEDNGTVAFEPESRKGAAGVILYPGAFVAPEAYAPLALEIAEQGYPVYIARMPMNLAVLSPEQGSRIMALHPEIENWAVGGHSLGGAMAPELAERETQVKGVFFLAAYPADDSIKDADVQVVSLWGSDDGVADLGKVQAAEEIYPGRPVMAEIAGGNHAGFGDYGAQKGDNPAAVSNTEQMRQAAEAVIELLEKIS